MSVICATSLYRTKTQLTSSLERIAVQNDLIDCPVVIMEPRKWPYGTIYHWSIKPSSGSRDDSIFQILNLR